MNSEFYAMYIFLKR